MIRATVILYLLAFLCVVVGLWDHSWQLILAGTMILVVWPIVQEEVTPHETHHNPDDGDGHGRIVGLGLVKHDKAKAGLVVDAPLGLPTDSRVLDVSRAGCGTRTKPYDWSDDASS